MDYQLKDKKVLVTGSTSGIGYAIAKLLLKEGAEVIINGRAKKRIDQSLEMLRAEIPKSKVSGVEADFRDKSSVMALIDKIKSVDILINNVGIFKSQSFEETTDADWMEMIEVNVMSAVRLSRAFMPKMIQNNWGRIVFISSECAMLVPEDLIAYSMTKAAMLSVSRGLAQLTRGTAVTVNAVLPGSTLSEGAQRFLNEQAKKEHISEKEVSDNFFSKVRTTSLLERFASPEEIAHMVAYISSPLSSATNGATLKADGGSVPGIF